VRKKEGTLSSWSENIQHTSPASANNQNFSFMKKATAREVFKLCQSTFWFVWEPGSQPYLRLRFGRRKDLISKGIV